MKNNCKNCINKNNRIKDPKKNWCNLNFGTLNKRGKIQYPIICEKKEVKINEVKLNKELDKLWGQCVRKIGICEHCGKKNGEEYIASNGKKKKIILSGHHLCSREFRPTRLLLQNGVALCFICHTSGKWGIHHNTIPLSYHFIKLFGNDFIEKLIEKSRSEYVPLTLEQKIQKKKEFEEFLKSDKKIERKL